MLWVPHSHVQSSSSIKMSPWLTQKCVLLLITGEATVCSVRPDRAAHCVAVAAPGARNCTIAPPLSHYRRTCRWTLTQQNTARRTLQLGTEGRHTWRDLQARLMAGQVSVAEHMKARKISRKISKDNHEGRKQFLF